MIMKKLLDKKTKTTEWNEIGRKLNKTYELLDEMSQYDIYQYFDKQDQVKYGSEEYNKIQEELKQKRDARRFYTDMNHITFKFALGTRRSYEMKRDLENLIREGQERGYNLY